MKRTHLYLAGVACFLCTALSAQETGFAYSKALAYATVATLTTDAAAGNPAGLANLKSTQLNCGYSNQAVLPDLSRKYAAISSSIYHNILTFNINTYGITSYRSQSAGLSYTRKLRSLALGIKAQYHQLSIPNYGQTHSWSYTIGTQFQLTETIRIGSTISSVNPTANEKTATPTLIRVGIAYRISDKLEGLAELDKLNPQQAYLLMGIDYQILQKLAFRIGFDSSQKAYHTGFGLQWAKFTVDIATNVHPILGLQPELCITYEL